MSLKSIHKYKLAKSQIKEISVNKDQFIIVNYSYINIREEGTRIVAIAIKEINTGESKIFSIEKTAEIKKIPFDEILNKYDEIEKEMLKKFFSYVKRKSSYNWIHWEMNNSFFGFEALKDRATMLGIRNKFEIINHNKKDLSIILTQYYGDRFIEDKSLEKLLKFNNLLLKEWLPEEIETKEFINKNFNKISRSQMAKVNALETMLEHIIENKLKTKSNKLRDIYGISPQGIYDYAKEKWYISGILLIYSIFDFFHHLYLTYFN